MDWLGQWLKSVIMIVLFAAFVDMILPGKKMERYARVVLSFLILLTLLGPIVSLLTDSPENKLAAELRQLERGSADEAQLDAILAQAEQFKEQQRNQSLQWAGEELARVMKEDISRETGERVQSVRVVLALGKSEELSEAVIQSVSVKLVPDQSEPAEPDSEITHKPIGITPVDAIDVNIHSTPHPNTDKPDAESGSVQEASSAEAKSRVQPVREFLSSQWDLKPEQITVELPGADSDTTL